MITLVLAFVAFAATALPMSVCDAGTAKPGMDGKRVAIVGLLVFSRHSAHLIEPGEILAKTLCAVFTIFPGTPEFLTPGIRSQESESNSKLQTFSREYKSHSDLHPASPKIVLMKGILKVSPDFKGAASSAGNGFGYRGNFRTAIVVEHVEIVDRR